MKVVNRNKIALKAFLLISGLFFVANLSAQQTSGSDPESGVEKASKAQTSKANDTKSSSSKSSERVFKPSEEISEDSPVPFPIDI